MFKKVLMGIIGKRKLQSNEESPSTGSSTLQVSKAEASFIASKLNQAQYQGSEFDMYFRIMQKLKILLESK